MLFALSATAGAQQPPLLPHTSQRGGQGHPVQRATG